MRITTKKLALAAVLTALALGLSTLENLFPVSLLVPLPGIKLGLANIVTVFALYRLGAPFALAILVARCLLGAMFAGNVSALLFSLMGGVLAMLVMILLRRAKRLSVYGVSIAGAAAHNIGQICAAMLVHRLADGLRDEPFVQSHGQHQFCAVKLFPVIPRERSDRGNPFLRPLINARRRRTLAFARTIFTQRSM